MGIPSLYGALVLWGLIFLQPTTSSNLKNVKLSLEQDPSRFPANFLFGTASSAYQFEGAYLTDGKGLNNWDIYTHKQGNIIDKSNGDTAVDQYHHYKEDIDLMSSLGVNSYRFSISWARVLPKGRFGDVNQVGISYYSNLIDALLRKDIQPFVTLTHFDVPQELEERYGSWLSHESQEDFGYYADVCFRHFGDRVKYWATFNEPNYQIILGYRSGEFPPSRCSRPFGNCSDGNSEEEPFIAAHNIILSHATAVDIYRTKYQKEQGGIIGIVLHCAWFVPASNSEEDNLARERALAFFMNWFLDPVILGDYPAEMREILGPTLPEFSSMDKEKLNQGLDFIGVNHYTSYYIKDCLSSSCEPGIGTSRTEGFYQRSQQNDSVPIGKKTRLDWQQVYPQGMEKIVVYVKERYNNTPMIISENGYGEPNTPALKTKEFLNDTERVEYMAAYLDSLMTAIKKGADVRGYFAWSLLDNFEWTYGYTVRFGLHHVDYPTLERTPKLSATWFKDFITRNRNPDPRCNNMKQSLNL